MSEETKRIALARMQNGRLFEAEDLDALTAHVLDEAACRLDRYELTGSTSRGWGNLPRVLDGSYEQTSVAGGTAPGSPGDSRSGAEAGQPQAHPRTEQAPPPSGSPQGTVPAEGGAGEVEPCQVIGCRQPQGYGKARPATRRVEAPGYPNGVPMCEEHATAHEKRVAGEVSSPAGQTEAADALVSHHLEDWQAGRVGRTSTIDRLFAWRNAAVRQAREEERATAAKRIDEAVTRALLDAHEECEADREQAVSAERAKVNAEWRSSLGLSPGSDATEYTFGEVTQQAVDDAVRTTISKVNAEWCARICDATYIGVSNAGLVPGALSAWRDEAVRKARVEARRELADDVEGDNGPRRDAGATQVILGSFSKSECATWLRADADRLERDQPAESAVPAACPECHQTGRHLDGCRKGQVDASTTEAPETVVLGRHPIDGSWHEPYNTADYAGQTFHFIRADVVEKRVAEAVKRAEFPTLIGVRRILGARQTPEGDEDFEDTEDAARRVVAVRDAALKTVRADAAIIRGADARLGEAQTERDDALARVRGLEALIDERRRAVEQLVRNLDVSNMRRDELTNELVQVRREGKARFQTAERERDEEKRMRTEDMLESQRLRSELARALDETRARNEDLEERMAAVLTLMQESRS